MLATVFLPSVSLLTGRGPADALSQSGLAREILQSHLHASSSLMIVAASVACDTPSISASAQVFDSALSTDMVCSPPRTQTPTYVANYTRRLTVPATALPSRKTRRRRTGGGSDDGDGGDDWGSDDGGSFGGGGDDGFGGGDEGPFDGDSMGRWLQDAMLFWTVFCAWSMYSVAERMTRPKAPALTAVVYSTLKAQLVKEPLSIVV